MDHTTDDTVMPSTALVPVPLPTTARVVEGTAHRRTQAGVPASWVRAAAPASSHGPYPAPYPRPWGTLVAERTGAEQTFDSAAAQSPRRAVAALLAIVLGVGGAAAVLGLAVVLLSAFS
jgi:hypothetical protein